VRTARLDCAPYRRALVPAYAAWMRDAALRADTASDELTLAGEYAAQRAVAAEAHRVTFIFFDRAEREQRLAEGVGVGVVDAGARAAASPSAGMAGDANLTVLRDARRARDAFFPAGGEGAVAEVMVMVGDARARRRGFAREALVALLRYGAERLRVRGFVAKVREGNAASLALFASLGFARAARARGEVTLARDYDGAYFCAAAYRVEAAAQSAEDDAADARAAQAADDAAAGARAGRGLWARAE